MILRPPRDDDFGALLEVLNAAARAADGEDEYSAEELWTWLGSPKLDPERDVRVVEEDGRLIGYADVDAQGKEPVTWWSDVRVHPDAEAATVVPKLMQWLEQRAGGGRLRVWTPSKVRPVAEAYERLGLQPIRHSFRMAIEFDGEPQPPDWPGGISVETFEPGQERAVYAAFRETWLDTWAPEDESLEEWSHWTYEREGFDRTLWFLARDGGEIAGFSLCRPSETRPDTGFVNLLGVRRPWRRRGLGEALLRHCFVEFHRRGFRRVALGVDAESPTGATRLYERVGMRVVRRLDFYEKGLGGR
jgi:mycothiol synthase